MAKRWRRGLAGRTAAAALALLAASAAAAAGDGFWSDGATGFAIGGYDPVAYFVDSAPRRGDRPIEYEFEGATFRFVSEANRAAFAADPEVYAPQFGGYDAARAADGVEAEGNPRIWLIEDDRLYLFATTANRYRWQSAGEELHRQAEARWEKR